MPGDELNIFYTFLQGVILMTSRFVPCLFLFCQNPKGECSKSPGSVSFVIKLTTTGDQMPKFSENNQIYDFHLFYYEIEEITETLDGLQLRYKIQDTGLKCNVYIKKTKSKLYVTEKLMC